MKLNIKRKMSWRLQKFREAKNMGHLQKMARKDKKWPKRESVGATTTSSTTDAKPPKPFGVHILPQTASNARQKYRK